MNSINATDLKRTLQKLRLVPVASLPSVAAGLQLSELLVRNRLPIAEITFRTPCAAGALAAIRDACPEVLLLAGTVLTPRQVDQAVAAGAAAIVSPGFTPAMAAYCRDRGVPFLPGVCTPSEVQMAVEAGLNILKFFPAELAGGVAAISLFRTIYQDVMFMPTGGITIDNLKSYLACNNTLCCGGTWLSPEHLLADGRWEEIDSRVAAAVALLERISG